MRNTRTLLTTLCLTIINLVSAQVVCIDCAVQNDSIVPGSTNLILNGSFENHNCIPQNWFNSSYCPNSSYYNCDITDWTCTGGGPNTYADIVDNGYSQVADGSYAVYFGSSFGIACPSSDTSCFATNGCTTTNVPTGYPIASANHGGAAGLSLEQTVIGLVIGNRYILEFWAGGEQGHLTPGFFAVDVGFGDTLLRNTSTPYPTGVGKRHVVEFDAINTSHTIKFTNWGHICTGCTELILDDVRLFSAAELGGIYQPCLSTSIQAGQNLDTFDLYPNPASNGFSINADIKGLVELTDIQGRVIRSWQGQGQLYSLNRIASGTYLVRISTGSQTSIAQLIIE